MYGNDRYCKNKFSKKRGHNYKIFHPENKSCFKTEVSENFDLNNNKISIDVFE